ncbi:right-handed parallel beta-helix repeat-containing protein [bacterium]|nr:right-handed parallel beta-helix repeat-containing protein [bacterium]
MTGRSAILWALGVARLAAPVPGEAATHRVPSEYPTIQGALDVSALGDTVLVAPGTYSDWTISFNGVPIVAMVPDGVIVVSEAGPEQTVIDLAPLEGFGQSAGAFGHFAHTSGQTVIDGFRVTGFPPNSVGVSGSYSALIEIRNCVFEVATPADPGVRRRGISANGSDLHVTDCTFVRCSGPAGSGIHVLGNELTVERCTFIECENQGIRASSEGTLGPNILEVRDCVFQRVSSSLGGCNIQSNHMDHGVVIDGCVFEEPGANGAGGVALSISGVGPKAITANVFRNMNVPATGAAAVYLLEGTAVVDGNTFVDLNQTTWPGVVLKANSVTDLQFSHNIIAHTSDVAVFDIGTPNVISHDCNVFWDNVGGIGIPLSPTDRIADPQFCDPDNGDYTLQGTSPCLPDLSLGCGLIGALGQGCGTVSLTPETWGRIKSGFRTGEGE